MAGSILYSGDTSLGSAASYLAGLITSWGWDFDYLPSDIAITPDHLAKPRSLLILSDYPAARFTKETESQALTLVQQGCGLLMIGGAYLCFEGAEKILEKLFHSDAPSTAAGAPSSLTPDTAPTDLAAYEADKIRGAVRTDFILSAEIIVIALGTVADVAALHGLNRALVAQGLKVMARRDNIGMAALIDASRLNRAPTSTSRGAGRWISPATAASAPAASPVPAACEGPTPGVATLGSGAPPPAAFPG